MSCPSENVSVTAYEPTGSMPLIAMFFLPTCRTSCPGPCPRTSADGEYTRKNSYGSSNRVPLLKAISSWRET